MQQLEIARLGDEPALPTRIGEIFELFGFFLFLYLCRVPSGHDVNQIAGDPARSFKFFGIGVCFRIEFIEKQTLVFDVNQTVQQGLKNIRKHPAAARFRDHPGRELIGRRVDMVHFDARENASRTREE